MTKRLDELFIEQLTDEYSLNYIKENGANAFIRNHGGEFGAFKLGYDFARKEMNDKLDRMQDLADNRNNPLVKSLSDNFSLCTQLEEAVDVIKKVIDWAEEYNEDRHQDSGFWFDIGDKAKVFLDKLEKDNV